MLLKELKFVNFGPPHADFDVDVYKGGQVFCMHLIPLAKNDRKSERARLLHACTARAAVPRRASRQGALLMSSSFTPSFTPLTMQDELEAWLKACPLDAKQLNYSVTKAGNGNLRIQIGGIWEYMKQQPLGVGSSPVPSPRGPLSPSWAPPGMLPTAPFSAAALPLSKDPAHIRRAMKKAALRDHAAAAISPRFAGIADDHSADSDEDDGDESWSVKAESGNSHEM